MDTSNPYQGDRRAGPTGFPLPDVELFVSGPDTADPLPVKQVGSVEVRGLDVLAATGACATKRPGK